MGPKVGQHTYAIISFRETVNFVGSTATGAESLKRRKYCNVIGNYVFELFGVE